MAYKVGCLGVTDADWKQLALEALQVEGRRPWPGSGGWIRPELQPYRPLTELGHEPRGGPQGLHPHP